MRAAAPRVGERGQVLPMWLLGTVCTLALAFLSLNYANTVRWQIRAQNAADATAQSMVAAQADEWNQQSVLLYSANVEEFRIRTLIDGILLAINKNSGCDASVLTLTTAGSCNRIYTDLKAELALANQRYTNDILMLHSISDQLNQTGVISSAKYAMGFNSYWCSSDTVTQANWNGGGDCGVKYTQDAIAFRTKLKSVNADATNTLVSALGRNSTAGTDTENNQWFAPVSVDVIACAKVPPIVPSFGPFHWPTYYAIGRAAATNAQVDQDWLEPGSVCDPVHTGYSCGSSTFANFQPIEEYTPTLADASGGNWFTVNFGGNNYTANAAVPAFQSTLTSGEMSAMVGWWGPIPISPFGPAVSAATVC